MSSLYNFKREALTSNAVKNVSNINDEIEKARSQSPLPVKKECKDTNKKLAFKSDIDDIKKSIDKIEDNIKNIQSEVKFSLEDNKKELTNFINDTLGEQKKYFDTLKIENLKGNLNLSIKDINSNLKNIASSLVSHLDSINELKSRVSELELMVE